jgi:hypothetical protein
MEYYILAAFQIEFFWKRKIFYFYTGVVYFKKPEDFEVIPAEGQLINLYGFIEKSNFEKGKMTLNQVSRLILELSEKVNILEQERANDKIRINNLEALVKKQNKESKTNIFKTLNLIQPHIGFVEWIKTINIKE